MNDTPLCSDYASDGSDPECPVCMTGVSSGTRLSCGHVFHNHCIQRWLGATLMLRRDTGTCPLCRINIPHTAINTIEAIRKNQVFQQMLLSVKQYM